MMAAHRVREWTACVNGGDDRRGVRPRVRPAIRLAGIAVAALLAGCASQRPEFIAGSLKVPKAAAPAATRLAAHAASSQGPAFGKTPAPPGPFPTYSSVAPTAPVAAGGKPVTLNAVSMPLPTFINEVYGNVLHLNFHIDQDLLKHEDLVTLRVSKPVPPLELYHLANQVLSDYGVSIGAQQGQVIEFGVAKASGGNEAPLIVSGLTLPSVPIDNRPIFQFVPVKTVSNVSLKGWLQQVYKSMGLQVQTDVSTNGVLLEGPPAVVKQAAAAIPVLDQPAMRGRYSVRIQPMFLSASDLAQALVKALQAEGYSASSTPPAGAVLVIPIEADNSVIAFASSRDILGHVESWAKALDQPPRNTGEGGIYFYQVENTDAASLAAVIAPLIGAQSSSVRGAGASGSDQTGGNDQTQNQNQGGTPTRAGGLQGGYGGGNMGGGRGGRGNRAGGGNARAAQTIVGANGQRLVVDTLNNTIIYKGPPEDWAQLRPMLAQLDSPSRMVLVQVTVAEVTLTNTEQFGIEWALRKASIGGLSGQLGTIGGLSLGSSGLNYFPMSQSGQTQAVLNAFASSNKVTVLSTPSLMVQSGQNATINVGSRVPTLSSNTLSPVQTGGNSSLIQQIQYLSTGVMMKIQPVVHSGDQVSINLDISVSSAQPTTTSKIDSPTISEREASTTLSLKDGGSVLLGGLMTTNNSKGNNRVPLLGDIPIIGQLFRSNSNNRTHTELMILIVPYIVSGNNQAEAVTKEFMQELNLRPAGLPRTLKTAAPAAGTHGAVAAPPAASAAQPGG